MTFDDDDMDLFDPVVAEKFALLDRVTPTTMQTPATEAMAPVVPISRPNLGRSRYLLAAAAGLVVVAGASIFAINQTDSGQVEASNDGNSNGGVELQVDDGQQSDKQSQADATDSSLVVELPEAALEPAESPAADPTAGDQSAIGSADGSDSSASEGGTEAEPAEASTNSADPSNESDSEPTVTEPTSQATIAPETTTTTDATIPEETAVPATTATTRGSLPSPGSSWLNPPTEEKMITIRGTVTEVFTDCQSRMILNDQGEIESVGPVSCDGGSHIIVNGNRIQTTSGYTTSENFYGKHVSTLRPGQSVVVTAVRNGSAGGLLTLDCVLCKISLGG